jgi:hypothetical protein
MSNEQIMIHERCGDFAENKDIAKELRIKFVLPAAKQGKSLRFNFNKVKSTTQSFIHALLSQAFQQYGEKCLDLFEFRKCNKNVKAIIGVVINYSLE